MLNCREINAVLAEFQIDGAWLKKVRQPDYRGIILEFSSPDDPSALAVIMAPPYPRLHLFTSKGRLPRALPKPPRFTAVLKSRLQGARLTSVAQLGLDRIVRFAFNRSGEELNLDVKLWGNSANIILSGSDGIIIDTYSRRPKRMEAPGEKWPPAGIGISRGNSLNPGQFPLRQFPGKGSLNRRVENYYRELESAGRKKQRLELWEAHLNRRKTALAVKEQRINQGITRFEGQLKDGHLGDTIMAHLHELDNKSTLLEAEDWESPGSRVRIPLDMQLTPLENAEKYYHRQKRAARGLKKLEEDRKLCQQTRYQIEELHTRLRNGDIESEPFDNHPPGRKSTGSQTRIELPGLWISRPPFLIAVGRNAKESDSLLRHWARGNDLWLHVRDYPGSHVFIRYPRGKSVPLEILLDAGNLALSYSKAKASKEADLYYTRVKYLRRPKASRAEKNPKSGKTATVLPTHEKNLHIKLDENRLKILKEDAEIGV